MDSRHPLESRFQAQPRHRAVRVLLVGIDGIGKTTFGLSAPSPTFLCAEPSRIPSQVPAIRPNDWKDVLTIVGSLVKDPWRCKTLVIDTVDWLESDYVIDFICRRDHGKLSDRLIRPGGFVNFEAYGWNGGDILAREWKQLLSLLQTLYEKHGVNIVLLAHAGPHRKKNASGDDYDVIGPKVHRMSADLFCEWPDAVLYAEFRKEVVRSADPTKVNSKAKVITSDERICWTQHRGAHRAKNRFGMPESIPFSWDDFAKYALADVDALSRRIAEILATRADPSLTEAVNRFLSGRFLEAGLLYRVLDRLEKPKRENEAEDDR